MGKYRTGKCRRVGELGSYMPWFRKRRAKNRVRNKMAKRSRRINRVKK